MSTNSLGDLFPVQDNYYVLYDGTKYAKHGNEEASGLLAFSNLERAEHFCMTVGKGLPAFQPVQIDAEAFLRLVEETGAFCVAHGLKVTVATIIGYPEMTDSNESA